MNDVSEFDMHVQDNNPCSWEVETEICGGVVDTLIECGQIDGDKFSQGDRHDSECRRFGPMCLQDRLEPKCASNIVRADEVFEHVVPRHQVHTAALRT